MRKPTEIAPARQGRPEMKRSALGAGLTAAMLLPLASIQVASIHVASIHVASIHVMGEGQEFALMLSRLQVTELMAGASYGAHA